MYFWPRAWTWASMFWVYYRGGFWLAIYRLDMLWKYSTVKRKDQSCNYSVVRDELTSCSSRGTLLSFNLWTSADEAPTSRAAESKKGAFMVGIQ